MGKRANRQAATLARRRGTSLTLVQQGAVKDDTRRWEAVMVWPDHQWVKEVYPWVCWKCGLVMVPGWNPTQQCMRKFQVGFLEVRLGRNGPVLFPAPRGEAEREYVSYFPTPQPSDIPPEGEEKRKW